MSKNVRKRNKSEKVLENEALKEEGISILVILVLAFIFIIIGVVLGYYLYKLALSSSGVIDYYKYIWK